MEAKNLENLRYPVGKYTKTKNPSESQILEWIETIERLPKQLNNLTKDLSIEQLHWLYRPEGWNIKQVIHHLADSHMNSIIRFKLALTEDVPTIKPYFEDRWALLTDNNDNNTEHTISLLTGLHAKWGTLLRSLTKDDLSREYIHPEYGKHLTLEETIGIYEWHCRHHLAHIEQALKYHGKF